MASLPTGEIPTSHATRILCVDDNRDLADSTLALLDFAGYKVRVCYEGYCAVRQAIHFRPHVCLIDLHMPGMNGIEVARQIIRDCGGNSPFLIAVTAMSDDQNRQATKDAGFHLHLVKPVLPNELLEAIKAHCGEPDT